MTRALASNLKLTTGRKGEREAAAVRDDVKDEGGEAGLLGDDKSSFKEIGSKSHDKSKRRKPLPWLGGGGGASEVGLEL
jgi:hypothetical protein